MENKKELPLRMAEIEGLEEQIKEFKLRLRTRELERDIANSGIKELKADIKRLEEQLNYELILKEREETGRDID